ncbi:hypothetical protein LZ009_04080 [Ramlibacter sp. XY19]|uniref:hypothetical protein n=1 Tax=Ramlibacter paludis TaxID=2908000 RepID=UPI0023DA7967|nr:hypothetical protein [Ramlibacter paludis]MCG2591952.1 hypothetical protein [Ramlibacter paludis]
MDSQPLPLSPEEPGLAPQDSVFDAPDDAAHARYCPMELLACFALLMAGHGRCVNTDMMLGDGEYAMWQLSCAKAMDDAELGDVAMRLAGYFDDPRHSATPMLGTA